MSLMGFTIHWSRQAEKCLSKLPKESAQRIVRKVDDIRENPFHFLEHFEGADFFKLRIGVYRLLLDIDLHHKVLSIRVIGHRRNVYHH